MDNFKINLGISKTDFSNGHQKSGSTALNNDSFSGFSNLDLDCNKTSFQHDSSDSKTNSLSSKSTIEKTSKDGKSLSELKKERYSLTKDIVELLSKKSKIASCIAFKTEKIEPMEKELKGATIDYDNYSKLFDAQNITVNNLEKQLKNISQNNTKEYENLKNQLSEAQSKLEKYKTKRDSSKEKIDDITPKLERAREEYDEKNLELDGATNESIAQEIEYLNNKKNILDNQAEELEKGDKTKSGQDNNEFSIINNLLYEKESSFNMGETESTVSTLNADGTISSLVSDFDNDTDRTVVTDKSGRIIKINVDSKGHANDSDTIIEYSEDGSKIETTYTAGRTVTKYFDKNDKLIKIDYEANEVESDGKIDDTQQGSIGDCWLLTGVNGMRQTEVGKKVISDSIQKNPGGSVTVHLKGADKSYTFNADELAVMEYNNRTNQLSTGDLDMQLIEKAMSRLRLDQNKDGILPKYVSDDFNVNDPISGGFGREVVMSILPENQYSYSSWMNKEIPYTLLDYDENNTTSPDKMLEAMQKNPENKAIYVSFNSEDPELGLSSYENGNGEREEGDPLIVSGHEYHVSKVDDEYVYVVNPWNSEEYEIPYPKDKFIQNLRLAELFNFKP